MMNDDKIRNPNLEISLQADPIYGVILIKNPILPIKIVTQQAPDWN